MRTNLAVSFHAIATRHAQGEVNCKITLYRHSTSRKLVVEIDALSMAGALSVFQLTVSEMSESDPLRVETTFFQLHQRNVIRCTAFADTGR